jgi:hypothetical protein
VGRVTPVLVLKPEGTYPLDPPPFEGWTAGPGASQIAKHFLSEIMMVFSRYRTDFSDQMLKGLK